MASISERLVCVNTMFVKVPPENDPQWSKHVDGMNELNKIHYLLTLDGIIEQLSSTQVSTLTSLIHIYRTSTHSLHSIRLLSLSFRGAVTPKVRNQIVCV